MSNVEENVLRGPMKLGIGTKQQFPALYAAGADEVREPHFLRDDALQDEALFSFVFRPEDVIVLVQPNLLSVSQITRIARAVSGFEVPKCGTFKLNREDNIRRFRQLKPDLEGVERLDKRGGTVRYPQPTDVQMERLVGWWHDRALTREQIVERASGLMGASVPIHWVRDKVGKATGSKSRDSNDPGKTPFNKEDEA